jgi:hypothetical protein
MSDSIETAGLMYGLLFEGGNYMQFTELESAKNQMIAFDLRGVKYTLRKREVHTRVSWTPWVEVK